MKRNLPPLLRYALSVIFALVATAALDQVSARVGATANIPEEKWYGWVA